jgi:hypothetical protein
MARLIPTSNSMQDASTLAFSRRQISLPNSMGGTAAVYAIATKHHGGTAAVYVIATTAYHSLRRLQIYIYINILFGGLCTPFFGPLGRFAHHQHTPHILLHIPIFSKFFRHFFLLPSSGWNQRA